MKHSLAALALVAGLLGPGAAFSSASEEMASIPGGAFMMGSAAGGADEQPVHRVAVETFMIDKLPVTNAEFASFLNAWEEKPRVPGLRLFDLDDTDARIEQRAGVYRSHPGFENRPVVEPSWYGAREYCRWRQKRLPTEAEWEFAARGSAGRLYPWGDAPPDPSRAQYNKGWGETSPVGSHPAGATPQGVLNMAGNVHEWTSSLYRPYPYRADDGREDPDILEERVTRGGAADTHEPTLRATWRGEFVSRNPGAGHHNIGFRCAKSAPRNI